jgi:hypothetical protein
MNALTYAAFLMSVPIAVFKNVAGFKVFAA